MNLKCLALSGLCALGGTAMFGVSFHQSVRQELASPYSTQQVVITQDLPQPWQGLLRWGGALIALGGGTGGAIVGVSKQQPHSQQRRQYQAPELPQTLMWDEQPIRQPVASPPPTGRPSPVMAAPVPTAIQQQTELDILTETARFLAESNFGGHVLFASTTGTGKTSSVLQMMDTIHQEYPAAEFLVIDPKGTVWGGLNESRIIDVNLGSPLEGVEKTLDLLQDLMGQLEARKRQRKAAIQSGKPYAPTPLILILDEYPCLLKAAKDCRGSYLQNIISKIESLAFMGREDGIKLFIVSQSPYVNQLGFDGSVRTQFCIVAQGLGINSKSFKPVIDAMQDGGCLPQTISQFRMLCSRNPKHPVVFSSVSNRVELAPDLSQIKQKNIFEAKEPAPMAVGTPPSADVDALAYLKQFEQSLIEEE